MHELNYFFRCQIAVPCLLAITATGVSGSLSCTRFLCGFIFYIFETNISIIYSGFVNMRLLYDIGIRLYAVLLHLLSPFHTKARLWVQGRKGLFKHIEQTI